MKPLDLKSKPKLCMTTGQLVAELSKLPKSLPIVHGFGKGVKPVVYNNIDGMEPQLGFEEND